LPDDPVRAISGLKQDQRTEYGVRRLDEARSFVNYARGELVEPVKPIVYWLDPATPEQWRPCVRQGVEDWQGPFETAGFKNAIVARQGSAHETEKIVRLAEVSGRSARNCPLPTDRCALQV
jgi:hypothetical protein